MTMSPEQIKKLRAELDMNQSEFADFIGVSKRSVANYESGDSTPNSRTMAKLGYLQISISKLKRRHLKNMLEACKLPDNYFNKFRSYISRIFLELLEYECCDTNLVRDIRKKKIHKREREILSVDQMNLVMSYLKSNYYNFWRYSQIFLFSGGRTTEFFNLKAKNVDLEAQEFTVTIKKGAHYKEQTKVILKAVIPLWRELLKNAKPNDYVFSKGLMPGRIPLKANAITKRWYRVVKNSRKIIDAKGRPVAITADFYSLKHSFLDSLETDVAQLMASHTSSKTTIIYQVNKEKRDREELKKLEVSILKDV